MTEDRSSVRYKQTEIGIIPEDWEVNELGNIGNFKNGINKDGQDFGHGSPFVNLMDVFGINSISKNQHLGLVNSNDLEKKVYNLKEGDVIFIRSSVKPTGVGLTAVINRDLTDTVYSGFLIRFRDEGKLNTDFKKYCFSESKFRQRIITCSTVSANTNINQDNLKKVCLAHPKSLEEQRSIAEALSDVDTLIAALDKLVAKKRNLKTATIQQLLTGKKRLPGFGEGKCYKQTSIGVIPEDWEIVELKYLVDPDRKITYGIVVPGANTPNGVPMIRAQDYSRGWVDLEDLYRVSSEMDKAYKRSRVVTDDILLTIVGSVGNLAKVTSIFNGSNLTQQTARLAFHKKFTDANFYLNILSSEFGQKEILNYTKSGVQPSLNLSDVEKFRVPYPSLSEQTAIANVLSDMDTDITALETRLAKTQAIKQGMMQELLTGRTRLI